MEWLKSRREPLLVTGNLSRGLPILVLVLLGLALLPAYSTSAATIPQSGTPAILVIQSVPPNLPADGKQYQSIVISLQDIHNRPSLAVVPIIVNLFSSQPNVAAVNATVAIAAGHDYTMATLTTTNTPGTTVITASSTGFQSAFVAVLTVTPSGLASELRVFPAPASILSNPGESDGLIYVELQDQTGLPAKSATDVQVQLSTSAPLVVGLPVNNVTIPAGQIYATVTYALPSTSVGSATISAFSTGFSSGNAVVNVISSTGNVPCCKVVVKGVLETQSQTSIILPADGRSYSALEVLLVDVLGNPVRAPSGGLLIQLSSSKNTVASVPSSVFLPSGSSFEITNAFTGFLAGVSNITAFSQGYIGSSTTVQTVIPAPSKLNIYVAPTPKILSSLDQVVLVVQLQDSAGNPARAKAGTTILVTSSNSTVVSPTLFLTINKGDDFISTLVKASAVGTTTFTASSSGLSSSQVVLTTVPLPLSATISVASPVVYNTVTTPLTLSVALLGLPLSGASVTWTVSSGHLSTSSSTTDNTGSASVNFVPGPIGLANVTAIVSDPAIGQTVAHIELTVVQTPPPPTPSIAEEFLAYSYLLLIPVAIIIAYAYYRIRKRRVKRRAELEAAFQTVG
jgi:hypothetical protein